MDVHTSATAASPTRLIAHRAGNSTAAVGPASVVADTVEIDVHLFRGRLEVRHAKVLWPSSVLWERWYLDRSGERPLLEDVLAEVPAGLGLWFDLKGWTPGLTRRVVDLLTMRGQASRHPLTTSSRCWWTLGPARRAGLPTMRSVGSRWQRCLAVRGGPCRDGHVADHVLLDETVVSRLRRRNPVVVAWGIQHPERARQLVEWGVSGIIADDLGVLADLGPPDDPERA